MSTLAQAKTKTKPKTRTKTKPAQLKTPTWEEYQTEIEQMLRQLPDPDTLWSVEPPMESTKHWYQADLLVNCLDWLWKDRNDYFIGANLSVYHSVEQLRNRQFSGPDFFVVRNTERKPRLSWAIWNEEGRYPELIIELLSKSTQKTDKTKKKALYEKVYRTQNYFLFSPETLEFLGYRLQDGRYVLIEPDERGWLWSEVLELYLGVHNGMLRYFTPDGQLVPTPAEAAIAERKRAEAERKRAEKAQAQAEEERRRAQRLAEKLRELGIDPDEM